MYDAGKNISGRKAFGIVDSLGLLLAVVVVAANVSDNTGGIAVADRAQPKSGATRDIPLPDTVVELVDTYLAERATSGRRARLLVRLDSMQMTRFDLDHLLRSAGCVARRA